MVSRVNSWDIEEQIVLVHFRSHNIKLSAVQRLLQLKCPGKAYRTDRAVQTRIDILNQYERRKGRAALRGLLPGSWADRTVIDEWLVRQTTDTELFKRLTWLGDEELNIITEEGQRLDDGTLEELIDGTDDLVEMHRRMYISMEELFP